jgi:hypothetical protein
MRSACQSVRPVLALGEILQRLRSQIDDLYRQNLMLGEGKRVVSQTMEFTLRLRSAIAPRTARGITRAIAIMLAGASLFSLMLAAGAIGSSRGGPTTNAKAAGTAFVTAYGNPIKQVQYGLTPESVRLTADGGYIVLALTDSANGVGANWLLKLDGSGRPQWQKQLVCANGPPGDYALEVSAQQFSDGGYVLSGGILGCGGSYIQHALLE